MALIFDEVLIERVTADIANAFLWERTSEGADYWKSVVDNLEKIRRQLPSAHPLAASYITSCQRSNYFDTHLIYERFLRAAINGIEHGFSWSTSAQGYSYWLGVENALNDILSLKQKTMWDG